MESHGYHEPILILFSLLMLFLTIIAPVSLAVCLPKNPSFSPFGAPPLTDMPSQIIAPSPFTSPAYPPDGDSTIFPDYLSSPPDEEDSSTFPGYLSSPAYPPAVDSTFPDYLSSPEYAPDEEDSTFPDYLTSPAYAPASDSSPLTASAPDVEINPDFLFSPDYAPSTNGIDVNPALEKICNSTEYYEICVQLISPLLNNNGKTDLISIFQLAVKLAAENTKLAIASADKLALNKENTAELSSMIGDCKDSYTDSVENYQETLSALAAKDVGTMSSMLSASITDFSDCDDFLNGYKSPLLDYNSKLIKLTTNCLDIASLIE